MSVKPMPLWQWLQVACDSFLNRSGLFDRYVRIDSGVFVGRGGLNLNMSGKSCLKLVEVTDRDRRSWRVFKNSYRDLLEVVSTEISNEDCYRIEGWRLKCLRIQPGVGD